MKPHDRNPATPQAGLACEGEHCPYHNPSAHHMDQWPIARGGERVCPHGVGHPDPDYLAWRMRVTDGQSVAGVHGCDGCCVLPTDPEGHKAEGAAPVSPGHIEGRTGRDRPTAAAARVQVEDSTATTAEAGTPAAPRSPQVDQAVAS